MPNFSQTDGPRNEKFEIFSKPQKWVLICKILPHFISSLKKFILWFFKEIQFSILLNKPQYFKCHGSLLHHNFFRRNFQHPHSVQPSIRKKPWWDANIWLVVEHIRHIKTHWNLEAFEDFEFWFHHHSLPSRRAKFLRR